MFNFKNNVDEMLKRREFKNFLLQKFPREHSREMNFSLKSLHNIFMNIIK